MKKITVTLLMTAFAVPMIVSAQNLTTTGTSTATSTATSTPKYTVDNVCMQGVISAREDAVMAAREKGWTASKAAFAKRKTDLNAAWGIVDRAQRVVARDAAWKSFDTSMTSVKNTMKAEVDAAWAKANADALAKCKVANPERKGSHDNL